jgi:ethanolamine kinase
MGSEGRSWNGVAAAGGTGGGEEKMGAAVVAAPAEVPTSAASVDISLPLPEMTPRIMQVS